MNKFSLSRIMLTFLLLFLVFIFSPFKVEKSNDAFLDNKTICKALVDNITVEILRALAGSIGMILSVPLTVFARAYMD